MKYTPVLVGAAVGLVDGEITHIDALAKHKYSHGIFKFLALGTGFVGEMFFDWNPNVTYGLMTGASALIGARVAPMMKDHSVKSIATHTAAGPKSVAGCTACAAGHSAPLAFPLAAPALHQPSPANYRPMRQPTTEAG